MPSALDAKIQTSTKMRTRSHSQCRKGDIALIRMGADTYAAGEIVSLIAIEGAGSHVLANMFALDSVDAAKGVAIWHKRIAPTLVDAFSILVSVIWVEHTPGKVRTLVPHVYRGLTAVCG